MNVTYPVQPDYGRLGFASVSGTIAAVLTTAHAGRTLLIGNSLNAEMVLTYNGADWIYLPSAQGGGLDLIHTYIPAGTVLGIKQLSGAATAGNIGLTVV